jgi:hypothetical protein
VTVPARIRDYTAPPQPLGYRAGAYHGSPAYRRLCDLETEGRARAGQRYLFEDGRILRVIRVRAGVPADEGPALCRWEGGGRVDMGPWIVNVAQLLPDDPVSS